MADLPHEIPVIFVLTACLTAAGQQPEPSSAGQPAPALARYGLRPLVFEANRGQADAGVRFVAHGSGYALLLTD